MLTFQYTQNDEDISIGVGDFPKRLHLTRSSNNWVGPFNSNLDISLSAPYLGALVDTAGPISVAIGRIGRTFALDTTSSPNARKFVPQDGKGGYVVRTVENGTTVYTYYSSDGDQIRFQVSEATVCSRRNNYYGVQNISCSKASQWLSADGVTGTFSYNKRSELAATYGETDLARVDNSLGLSLALGYTRYKDSGRSTTPVFGITSVLASSDQLGTCNAQPSCSRRVTYAYGVTPPIDRDALDGTHIVLTKYTDALGNSTQYIYTGQTTQTYPILYSVRKPQNPTSDAITLLRPGPSGKFSVADGVGNIWTYSRVVNSSNNYVTTTRTDPLNASREYEFDAQGQLVRFKDEVNNQTKYYYGLGVLAGIDYPNGREISFARDSRGNVVETLLRTPAQGGGPVIRTKAQYPDTCVNPKTCNKPITTTDALNNVTNYEYDPNHGGVVSITAPAAAPGQARPQTRFTYGLASGAYVLTDTSSCRTTSSCAGTSDELITTFGYGANGLLPTSRTVRSGDGALQSSVTDEYDALGNLISEDGPLSGSADTWYFRYDRLGRMTGKVSPAPEGTGATPRLAERVTYDADGQVSAVDRGVVDSPSEADWAAFNPNETITSTYDTADRKTREVATAGGVTRSIAQYSYTPLGDIDCAAIRMNSATWETTTAACDLQAPGSAGDDRITKFSYDLAGRETKVTVGLGTSSQADTKVTTYTANSQIDTLKDANGNVTTYTYDGFDRLKKIAYPSVAGNDYEQLDYDDNSNVVGRRLRDGRSVAYSYDALGRLTLKDLPDGVAADVYFDYDLRGSLLSARFGSTNGAGIVNTYDRLGRLFTTTNTMSPNALTLSYQYDAAGSRTALTHPDGVEFGYRYDALGRLRNATWTLPSAGPVQFLDIVYDTLGRRAQINRGGGSTKYDYDASSRLTGLSQLFAGNVGNGSATFDYNPAGQIIKRVQSNEEYKFGGVMNVNRPYSVNGLNQYTTAGPATFTYDANGNLIGDGTNTYTYDAENRLTGRNGTTSLDYDPLGRLWQVTAGATTTRMLYDGDDLIAEYNGAGTLLRRYAFAGLDQPILSDEGGALNCSATRFLHTDERGSVIAGADCSGNRTSINSYDESGIPARTNTGRFQYTGQVWLSELGMYYYKARMYSPTLNRFMQTDPISYDGGMNLYAYAGNDPANNRDPSGLDYCSDGSGDICVTARRTSGSAGGSRRPNSGSRGDFGGRGALWALARNAPGNRVTTGAVPTQNQNITCNTKLPNGRTVGDYVREGRDELQRTNDRAMTAMRYGRDVDPLSLTTGAFAAIAAPGGKIDFKTNLAGRATRELLGNAGNFAYYAIGAGYIPVTALDLGAGGYGLYGVAKGTFPFSFLTGRFYSNDSARRQRAPGLSAQGCQL